MKSANSVSFLISNEKRYAKSKNIRSTLFRTQRASTSSGEASICDVAQSVRAPKYFWVQPYSNTMSPRSQPTSATATATVTRNHGEGLHGTLDLAVWKEVNYRTVLRAAELKRRQPAADDIFDETEANDSD